MTVTSYQWAPKQVNRLNWLYSLKNALIQDNMMPIKNFELKMASKYKKSFCSWYHPMVCLSHKKKLIEYKSSWKIWKDKTKLSY